MNVDVKKSLEFSFSCLIAVFRRWKETSVFLAYKREIAFSFLIQSFNTNYLSTKKLFGVIYTATTLHTKFLYPREGKHFMIFMDQIKFLLNKDTQTSIYLVVKMLFQGWTIKFQIKSKWHMFSDFLSLCLFFFSLTDSMLKSFSVLSIMGNSLFN